MIQVRRNGEVITGDLNGLSEEFARRKCVRLPELIEPELLGYLLKHIDARPMTTKFERDGALQFGEVLVLPPTEPALFIFRLLMNNRRLFVALETITGCATIGNFLGRIHSSQSGSGHQIEWHGDNAAHRLLGLTLELSRDHYTGGCFQLRRKHSQEILFEMPRQRPGDAVIFAIDPDLQHRLTLIESGGPRTVGAGWFRSQPDFRTFARNNFLFSKPSPS
jgi:hypothetical protein